MNRHTWNSDPAIRENCLETLRENLAHDPTDKYPYLHQGHLLRMLCYAPRQASEDAPKYEYERLISLGIDMWWLTVVSRLWTILIQAGKAVDRSMLVDLIEVIPVGAPCEALYNYWISEYLELANAHRQVKEIAGIINDFRQAMATHQPLTLVAAGNLSEKYYTNAVCRYSLNNNAIGSVVTNSINMIAQRMPVAMTESRTQATLVTISHWVETMNKWESEAK